jgi:prepilin-type N-terminal cleavage/methylation domain-containing protein
MTRSIDSKAGRRSPASRCSASGGYTLLELVVVLILLGVVAAVVATGLAALRADPAPELRLVIGNARDAAIRRGETIHLRVDRSGAWRMAAGAPERSKLLMSGRLHAPVRAASDLVFSPLGTCASPAESLPPAPNLEIDPLTCQVSPS